MLAGLLSGDTVDKAAANRTSQAKDQLYDRMETKIDPQASAMVFSAMDFIVAGLVMVTSIIWFRSKHVARFYEACKVSREDVSAVGNVLKLRQETWRQWRSIWTPVRDGCLDCPARRSAWG